MRAVLLCTIDPAQLPLFTRLRAEHYRFLIAQRHRIVFGGPLRIDAGRPPEAMLMVVEAASLDDARAFIADEPYARHGGFRDIRVHAWSQVVPEETPGALEAVLRHETEAHGSAP